MSTVDVILTQPIENNTSSMIRSLSIIRELPNMGLHVICYCPYPDKNGKYNNGDISIKDVTIRRYGPRQKIKIAEDSINGSKGIRQIIIVVAYKLFKKVDVFGSSLQFLKYRKYLKTMIKKDNCDILLTFSDPMPTHMIGKYCSSAVKEKYIQQWGDPLAADTIAKTALPKCIRKIIERNLIKKADRICYVSPLTYEEQKRMFPKYADRMLFLPTPSVEYKHTFIKNSKIKLGYFGSYNLLARDIRPLYDAIIKASSFELYLIGDSDISLQPKDNVFIKNRVSCNEVEEYVDQVDILVCLMNSKGKQIPGKMYHYAGSYKEILVIKDGECGDEIEKYFSQFNRYTFVENNKESILDILSNYSNNGIPDRKPLKQFSPDVIARQLLESD